MDIGIIGLANSGKTTIFNAVTKGSAAVASYASGHSKSNLGVAKVPDQRLDVLTGLFNPERKVPAEVLYIDIPAAPEGLGKTHSIGGEYLNALQKTDALLIIARQFVDPSVPSDSDTIDSSRDLETMLYELVFVDLGILERRQQKLADSLKAAKAQERDALNKELELLTRMISGLEDGIHVRDQTKSSDEERLLDGFQLLTAKPLILAANIGEDQLSEAESIESALAAKLAGAGVVTTSLSGKVEMELAQMDQDDEQEFRESLELGESGLNRIIRLSYDVLGLRTFFTVGEDEVRAWTVTNGAVATQAAGKIHTDLERGFIRAEVVAYDDLVECKTLAEARKRGQLRQEGKTYVVADGDVITILFNV